MIRKVDYEIGILFWVYWNMMVLFCVFGRLNRLWGGRGFMGNIVREVGL